MPGLRGKFRLWLAGFAFACEETRASPPLCRRFASGKTWVKRRQQHHTMESPDQLHEMFHMQKALNERIGVRVERMSEKEKTKWILNYSRAVTQEIAELTDTVPWKWWANYQKFDAQNARVEVVDLFHFVISLAQVLGMKADDVFEAYVKKNAVNFRRQASGYRVKDEHDSRHI
jgi:dimeric dUTPase (all-alpha-NTP-PPase superfamily)